MNYRHAFHAGNFADVLKHAVLAQVLAHLGRKPAPFRVIDTHAGIGLYDLAGEEAERTGEWRDGVGRLVGTDLPRPLAGFLRPWLDAVEACNPDGILRRYPGSPRLVLTLMRAQDRLMACELHPVDHGLLQAALAGDRRARALHLDGWTALNAFVPPPERRGLVLVDPPFEATDEMDRLTVRLLAARAKWPTGLFMAWYPVKDPETSDRLADALTRAAVPKWFIAELAVGRPGVEGKLVASAVALVNPPWRLAEEAAAALPHLVPLLGGPGGFARLLQNQEAVRKPG